MKNVFLFVVLVIALTSSIVAEAEVIFPKDVDVTTIEDDTNISCVFGWEKTAKDIPEIKYLMEMKRFYIIEANENTYVYATDKSYNPISQAWTYPLDFCFNLTQ